MGTLIAVARIKRRHRRGATALVALLAGLVAAAPMALWAAARQTSGSADAFVAWADPPDASVIICPPGHDPEVSLQPCFGRSPVAELDAVRSLGIVDRAAAAPFWSTSGGPSPDPAHWRDLQVWGLGEGADPHAHLGRPILLSGRFPAPGAADEVLVREPATRSLGLAAGDRVWLARGDEAEPAVVTVTGVVRTVVDLLPLPLESVGGPALLAPAWFPVPSESREAFNSVSVWLAGGDLAALEEALSARLPGQAVAVVGAITGGELATVRQAADFEGRAAAVAAGLAAVAAALLVGQVVSRQARSESTDRPALGALGLSDRQLGVIGVLRWVPAALGAMAVAGTTTVVASALGPVGVGRRGPWEAALRPDWTVVALGVALVALIVAATALAGSRRIKDAGTEPRARGLALGSPAARVGETLARRAPGRARLPLASAVGGTAATIALALAAVAGAASLDRVVREPERFGAPWDLIADASDSEVDLSGFEGVASAALIIGNAFATEGDPDVWVQALVPVAGARLTEAVIVRGRAPASDDEIALGSLTAGAAGAGMGDTFTLEGPVTSAPVSFRVVGTALVTDGFEPNVGRGAVVTAGGLARLDPDVAELPTLAVELTEGPGREEATSALLDAFPRLEPFPVPQSLANAQRVSGLAAVLAGGSLVVAAVTLSHALVVSVRRNRKVLATCRVLGFTAGQARGAVRTHASLLAVAATAIGLPLGLAGANWGWELAARSFGLASGPVMEVWVVVAAALAALAVANLAAALPARAAARQRPGAILRAE